MRKKTGLGIILSMVLFLLLPLYGCSSSSSGDGAATAQLEGTLAKGPVHGATIDVYTIDNGGKGDRIVGGTTDENGFYSIALDLGSYDGPLYVEATGGSYTDEATGAQKSLAGTLRAALPEAAGKNNTACITPLTELAVRKAGTILNAASIEASNKMISQFLGDDGDILTDHPFDPTRENAGDGAREPERIYTMILAALSVMADEENLEIEQLLAHLENDLKNNILDETGVRLKKAIGDFHAGPNNRSGGNAAATIQAVETIRQKGLEPVGDLKDVKKALLSFLQEPTKENFAALDELRLLAPQTPESHLYAALGELTDIYYSEAAEFFRQDLGIDFDADWDSLEAHIEDALLNMDNYSEQFLDAIREINLRLDGVSQHLEQAEGAYIHISLTGFDTVYLDDIDIHLLQTFTHLLRAGCNYIESIDFVVDQWDVNGEDIRDVEDPTEAQIETFFTNNPDLLTYADKAKLAAFRNAIEDASLSFSEVFESLEAMPGEKRNRRVQHAFYLPGDFALTLGKILNEETMASILDALNDPEGEIIVPHEEEIDERVVVGDDGYAYWQSTIDLYLMALRPNPEFSGYTLYDVAQGETSPRDFLALIHSVGEDEDVILYTEGEPSEYVLGLTETYLEDPIPTYTIAEAADIPADGSKTGWDSIDPLVENEHLTIKLAQNEGGLLMMFESDTMNPRIHSFRSYGRGSWQSLDVDSWGGEWRAGYNENGDYEDLGTAPFHESDVSSAVEAQFSGRVLEGLTTPGNVNSYYYELRQEGKDTVRNWMEIKFLPESTQ